MPRAALRPWQVVVTVRAQPSSECLRLTLSSSFFTGMGSHVPPVSITCLIGHFS